jgi:transposase-like protein
MLGILSNNVLDCPKCGSSMNLQRVEPGLRRCENQVFECARCWTEKTISVRTASKRAAVEWARH